MATREAVNWLGMWFGVELSAINPNTELSVVDNELRLNGITVAKVEQGTVSLNNNPTLRLVPILDVIVLVNQPDKSEFVEIKKRNVFATIETGTLITVQVSKQGLIKLFVERTFPL